MATEPKTGLTYWPAGAVQQDLLFNAMLKRFGAVGGQPSVLDKDLAAPPVLNNTTDIGKTYIVAASPTGLWAGKAGNVAYWNGLTWDFFAPSEGWRVAVIDEDVDYRHSGAAWVLQPIGSEVDDVLTDGVTTRAPSQNVVVDALALKAGLGANTFTATQTIVSTTSPAAHQATSVGGITVAASANDVLGLGFFGTLTNHDFAFYRNATKVFSCDSSMHVLPASDNTQNKGSASLRWAATYSRLVYIGAGTAFITSGSGTPEGVVVAPVGSLFTRTDGGAGTTFYVKESGAGSTGWRAV